MKTQNTYAILVIAVAAVSSGLTFQAIGIEDAPAVTADQSGIYGHITATLYDEDDNVKAYRQTDNRIVDRGLDMIADLVFNTGLVTGETVVDTMKLGVGTTGSATGDLDIESRTGITTCTNQTFTFSEGQVAAGLVNVTSGTVSFSGATCAGAITEAGLFDNDVGTGNMFARQMFSVINVGGSDQLDITWTVEIVDDGGE